MMDQLEQEHSSLNNQCYVCLSGDRKLSSLGIYRHTFIKITSNFDYQNFVLSWDDIKLCWECLAVLKRVHLFEKCLRKTLETFHLGQHFGSLSSLGTTILVDNCSNTFYVFENDVQPDIKFVSLVQNYENVHENYDETLDCYNDTVEKTEKEVDTDMVLVDPKKRKNNRWAKEKLYQNKKSKFRIVTDCFRINFNKVLITNEDLSLYLKNERDSEYFKSKRHKCLECVLTFHNETLLGKHVKKYHDNKIAPYVCDLCSSGILTKRHLVAHIHKHYYKYKCTLCDFTCYDKFIRQMHFKKKHRRIFQCLKCSLKFGSRKDFFKHHKEWHEKFVCEHCGVSFKMRYCIKNHIRKQHSPFECKLCNKRFARYNGLWLHNKTSHSVCVSSAYCVECDRLYPDVYRYKWHLANSTRHNRKNKPRVPCPGCEKVFTKKIYMKDHYNLVHLKYYKYRCEQCDKNFIRNADLMKHTRRVHEGIMPPKNKICCLCGRGFTTNRILSQHIRTHTGERPHECVSCGSRFTQSAALRAHTRALHAAQL